MAVKVREKSLGSGVWWVFINHHGQRKSKRIGPDKALADEVAKKIEARLVLGDMNIMTPETEKPHVQTFEEYATVWLESYIKPLRRASTYDRYKGVLFRQVFPAIGKRPIIEIRRAEIRAILMKHYGEGASRSTVCLLRDVISGPLSYALDEEIITANPVSGILRRLKLDRQKALRVEPFTFDETQLFLDTCKSLYPEYYAFFLTAFRTGARLGELLALCWGDIDWNRKFIQISKSYKLRHVNRTKTGKDRRVDMSDQLLETLRMLKTKRKKEALKSGIGDPVEIIFHRGGRHMEQNHIRRVFKRVLKKAGIREMRLHDIRHTFAGQLLSMGQSVVYVKEQLGHSSIQMTVDIYGRLIPSSNREAVNGLDTPHLSAPYPHPAKIEKL